MEQSEYMELYLQELQAIPVCEEEETKRLASLAAAGDRAACNRLIEGHLSFAAELASRYTDKGLTVSDLIAEANMALTLAVNEYRKGDFRSYIEREVCYDLEQALEEQLESSQVAKKMADSINQMNDITSLIARRTGREATIEETAKAMEMSEDEVEVLMKTALNAITKNASESMSEDEFMPDDSFMPNADGNDYND